MKPNILAIGVSALLLGASAAHAQATITRAPILTGWDILRSSNSTATILIPSDTRPGAYIPAPGGNVLTPAPTGGGLVLSGKAPVPVPGAPGKVVDVVAKAPVARAGLARGAARFLVGPGGAIALAAAPYLWDWFKGQGVGINTGPDFLERPFTLRTDEMVCPAKTPADYNQPSTPATWTSKQITATSCEWGWLYPNGYYSGVSPILQSVKIEGQPRPASADEVASHVEQPSAPPLTAPVVESAIKTGVDPFGGTDPTPQVSGPASVPGEKSTTTEQIRVKPGTTTPAQPGEASEPATRTTTTTTTTNFNYNDNKVTSNVTNQTITNITNNVTNQTTTEGEKVTETTDPQEPQEIKVCGLPNTPPCKIDETGTPDAAPTANQEKIDEYKSKMDEQRDQIKEAGSGIFDSFNIFFSAPPFAACTPYTLPRDMGVVDPCPVVDGVRAVMAYIWALGALFLCVGWIREAV